MEKKQTLFSKIKKVNLWEQDFDKLVDDLHAKTGYNLFGIFPNIPYVRDMITHSPKSVILIENPLWIITFDTSQRVYLELSKKNLIPYYDKGYSHQSLMANYYNR